MKADSKHDAQILIKINSREKKLLEIVAKDKGLTLSDLMRRGAWFYGSLDDRVFNYVREMSTRLGVRDHIIVSNMMLRRLAEDEAKAEVTGANLLSEFPLTSDGVMTGPRLFEMLKESTSREMREKK